MSQCFVPNVRGTLPGHALRDVESETNKNAGDAAATGAGTWKGIAAKLLKPQLSDFGGRLPSAGAP